MPVKKLEKLNDHSSWALWKISEDIECMIETLSLSAEDRGLLAGIKHPEKKKEWLAGRLCLKALTQQQGIDYVSLKKDEHGKPYLLHEEAEISLSNSYPYVAAILSQKMAVGIVNIAFA